MAEIVRIGDKEFKKRGPLAVWGLALVTIGVYFFVWYYKINKEAREYLGDETINPTVALMAVLFGWILLLIPPLVSVFNTGKRIARMEAHAGVQDPISPGIGLLLFLVARLDMPYQQEHLNRVWNRYLQVQSATPLLAPGQQPLPPGQYPPPPSLPPQQQPPQGTGGFTE
jgi:hypothetical protein